MARTAQRDCAQPTRVAVVRDFSCRRDWPICRDPGPSAAVTWSRVDRIDVQDPSDIERAIIAFAREQNGGHRDGELGSGETSQADHC